MSTIPLNSPPNTQPEVDPPMTVDTVERYVELHIPWITFIKVAVVLVAAFAVSLLWSLLRLVFLALFLAVTLHAFVDWLDEKGVKHWGSLLIVVGGLLAILTVTASLILPLLIEQGTTFAKNLPALHEEAMGQLPVSDHMRESIQRMVDTTQWEGVEAWMGHIMSAGGLR